MPKFFKDFLAIIADFGLFYLLWLYLGIPWYIAFFMSTLLVIGIWWVLAWAIGWIAYWTSR